jgi:hypothetical protein
MKVGVCLILVLVKNWKNWRILMNVERWKLPDTGAPFALSVPIHGRFAVVTECGHAMQYVNTIMKGEPVVGGQFLDLGEKFDTELKLRPAASNGLDLDSHISVVSGDSMQEVLSRSPKPFTPKVDRSFTSSGVAFEYVGDWFELYTHGQMEILAVVPAGGSQLKILYSNESDLAAVEHLVNMDNNSFASSTLALPAAAETGRAKISVLLPPGKYRLAVRPSATPLFFAFMVGMEPV